MYLKPLPFNTLQSCKWDYMSVNNYAKWDDIESIMGVQMRERNFFSYLQGFWKVLRLIQHLSLALKDEYNLKYEVQVKQLEQREGKKVRYK